MCIYSNSYRHTSECVFEMHFDTLASLVGVFQMHFDTLASLVGVFRYISTHSLLRSCVCSMLRVPRGLCTALTSSMNASLCETDLAVCKIIQGEFERQQKSVVLIASENYTSQAVMEAVGSVMTNKYSEGYVGARYYGGNEYIDKMESLCQSRALSLFGLNELNWGVNVQALSGTPANFAVYSALVEPHERIMALDLPHGGHLSHGYQTETRKVSMVSKFWTSMPYRLNESTGLIDYEECQKFVTRFRPKLLICGASAYSRAIDFKKFRAIADSVGAILMCDMAHIAGLVAAGVHSSPFEFADIVTTTTHKTLRGPRGALIFYKKGTRKIDSKTGTKIEHDFEKKINLAVFPGLQGGPHEHTISGIAVALGLAQLAEFKTYQEQVLLNCKALEKRLLDGGIQLVSGGSDNHLLLIDLRPLNVGGNVVEKTCESVGLVLNKNTVPGDKSAINPNGLRIGTPAMTTRGANEKDFETIADFILQAIDIAKNNDDQKLMILREKVSTFACKFETIGNPPK